MDRAGFVRQHGAIVAHKGYYDRHGKHFLLREDVEQRIIDEVCGGCLVSLYTMSLTDLTQYVQSMTPNEYTPPSAGFFMPEVIKMTEPNAVRNDAAWRRVAEKWIDANAAAESAKAEADKHRAKLVALAGDASAEGSGVRVAYYFQGGGIDYGRIPELTGLDLDPYRKSGSWRHKVSAQ